MSITEFLTARLDEREDILRSEGTSWSHRDYHPDDAVGTFSPRCPACVAGWPGRDEALADIAVKRAILKMHKPVPLGEIRGEGHVRATALVCGYDTDPDGVSESEMDYPCPTVLILAQPYADHPDFDPAWKM